MIQSRSQTYDRSFRFLDDDLNRRLLSLLGKSTVPYRVDEQCVVHYSSSHEEIVENELISAIRDQAYPSWQVLSCPKECTESYRAFMKAHRIPFRAELVDDRECFLIPGRFQPHSWEIEPAALE